MDNMEGAKNKKNLVIGLGISLIVIVVILLIAVAAVKGMPFGGLSEKAAQAKAESFINTELLAGQGTATVKVVGKEGDLYKLQVSYQGRNIDSYMTRDGKQFFPQSFDMTPKSAAGNAAPSADNNSTDQAPQANAPKSDKPVVELFVMSYCPYGTQMEKGILPAVEALGNKIDFKLKFVSYTMHGDKENQENLRQYCINKDQSAKFDNYLKCFLGNSDAASCLKSTGIDEGKVTSCMTAAAKQFDVTGTNFSVHKADNDKYGVQGSPTLVINGTTVSSGRDSAGLLKTICSAFNKAPSECQKQLSSDTPAPGFGSGTAASGSASAGCATN